MSEFTPRLNYKEDGHEINDEKLSITGSDRVYILKHHNIIDGSVYVYTQENKQGIQITDVIIGQHQEKPWQTILTFGSSVANADYYVSYTSLGDENDADDINELQDKIDIHSTIIASETELGHIKIGNNLIIDSDGVLHAENNGGGDNNMGNYQWKYNDFTKSIDLVKVD